MSSEMSSDNFLSLLQEHAGSFAKAVATAEGDWIVKGFIDIYKNIYTISIDTKIVSKVIELLLFPMFVEFAKKNALEFKLSPYQNFYPDITFIHSSGAKFAVDIKSTYRKSATTVNGMTLGAFTGYFRERESTKNTCFPYSSYSGHYVLGVIYTQTDGVLDERAIYTLADLEKIRSVIKDFQFFAQPKYRIASGLPGSGNTKNIGSITNIDDLINGAGPFAKLGEEIYDDYWMYYLTKDMALKVDLDRPYTNLKNYLVYKSRGVDVLKEHKEEIAKLAEEEAPEAEEEG